MIKYLGILTPILKTTKHWWKKLKKTEINGIISCIYEWVNNVKIPIGPKTIYRFNASLMKVSIKFKQK